MSEAELVFNSLTRRGVLTRNPRLIIEFKGERWGAHAIHSAQELLDGLCYANFVALQDIPHFLEENKDGLVVIINSEGSEILAWTVAELLEMAQ